MNEVNPNRDEFNSLYLLRIALKYKKHLLIVAVSSVILSVIFSSEYFIKPKFRSYAVVYPSNLVPYSTESPTEQMLQLFESEDIRDAIISDFDLYKHYQIDTIQKFPQTRLYNQMNDNIRIDKTKYESVEIEVWDTDPEVASNMVDSIISKMGQKAQRLQREKSSEVVVIMKGQLDYKKNEMDSMDSALKQIRTDKGILDFEDQVKDFSRVYYTEMAAGRAALDGNRPLDHVMNNFLQYGGAYVSLKEHLWRVRGTYNDIKVEYEDVLKDLSKELTYSNIITRPFPAEKKSYPVRSMIVILFTLSMLFTSFIIIVIFENARRLSLKNNGIIS